jgi:hypothetical protein
MSNLVFTQRGSLQVSDGSFPIAILPSTYPLPVSVAIFSNNSAAQYPYYSVLSQRSTPLFANVTGANGGPFGTTTNPSGIYYFLIVAIGSAAATDHTGAGNGAFVEINASTSFAGVTLGWN